MKKVEHLNGAPPFIQWKEIIFLLFMLFAVMDSLHAQRWMENLGRGTVAVRKSSSQVFVSWRILGPEFNSGITFNLYRGNTRVASNLRVSNYVDNTNTNSTYSVAAVVNGVEQARSPAVGVNTHVQGTNTMACVRVPVRSVPNSYIGLIHVGDLNGDGEYDYVFTRHPNDPAQTILVEAYLNNGTFLWQYNCGPNSVNKNNIEPGSATLDPGHGDNWMVYDLNNDGKAEVIIRSANGSVFGNGTVLRETNNNRQFISVLDGTTGREMSRAAVPTDYINDGPMNGQMGVAYLDGVNPSIAWSSKNRVGSGGFNMMVTTYTLTNGTLGMNWKWLRRGGCPDGHNLRIIDVDGDGKDEIIPFGFALRPNGTLLWDLGTQGVVHGDRFHIGDLDPNRPGIEGYLIQQDNPSKLGWAYYDARTGKILKSQFMDGVYDMARGMAGDLDPRHIGYEFHTFTDGLYNVSGTRTSTSTPSSYPNLRIWWDGDLLSENLDNNKMTKWNYTGQYEDRLYNFRNNRQWARNVPGCYGDIIGDWREEAVYSSDDGRSLLVFTTLAPTSERIYTLPHNPGYRNSMTNRGYYQSHMVDFYLGHGMIAPPTPNIQIVGKASCTPSAVVPHVQVDGGVWAQASTATVLVGGEVVLGPHPATGGSWSWSGPNGFTSASREITLSNIQKTQAGTYVATYTNADGCTSTSSFTVTVNSPQNQSPSVSITAPLNNASFTAPASFAITANATDSDGTITSVAFYNGSTLLGTDATAPYSFSWTNLAAGSYVITARATDNAGAVTISAGVTVNVTDAPVQTATIQAESACSADGLMNESTNSGYNGTGYVNIDYGIGTSASWEINSPAAQNVSLVIRYSNGSAASRNMSLSINGTVSVSNISFASTGGWTQWSTETVTLFLAAGKNSLKLSSLNAEGGPNLDELTFGAADISSATCPITVPNQAPVVSIDAPVNNASFTAPASVTISASASDADGTIGSVAFYNGATLIATDVNSPYSATLSNLAEGTYSLTAKATDNNGAETSSAPVTIVVNTVLGIGDVIGPNCGSVNTTISYEVSASLRANATNYSWWVNGYSQSATPVAGQPYKVNISTGAHFTGGQVCVGISFTVAPYYATYCKNVTSCSASIAAPEASVGPNPTEGIFTLTVPERVVSLSVSDMNGIVVFSEQSIEEGESIELGNTFIPGLYSITIVYTSGRVEMKRIQKL